MAVLPKNSVVGGKIDGEDFVPPLQPSNVTNINAKKTNIAEDAVGAVGSAAGKTLDAAEGVMNFFLHPYVMFGAPLVLWLTEKLGKGLEKVGLKTAGQKTQSAVSAINEKTLSKFVGDSFTKTVSKPLNYVAGAFGNVAGKVTNVIPIERASATASAKRLAELETMLTVFNEKHHGKLPNGMQDAATKAFDELSVLKSKLGSVPHEEFKSGLESIKKTFEAAGNGVKFTGDNKAATKAFNKIIDTAGRASTHHANASGWKNMGASISSLPKTIGNTKIIPAVTNVAFIGVSGLGMIKAVGSAGALLSSLKEMHKDITGEEISTVGVLFGSVPAPIREARSQLLKQFVFSETMGATGLAIAVKSAMNSRISALAIGAQMLLGIGGGVAVGESYLPHYTGFKEMHASGQEIPKEVYAGFLGVASPELRASGGENSSYTQKLSEIYANKRVSPQEIMTKISNGTLEKDIKAMIAEAEAAKKAASATAVANAPQQSTHSHVAALQGQSAAQPTRAVVGEHTKNLVEHAAHAKQALATQAFSGA